MPSKGLQVSADGFFVGAYTPSGDVVVMNVRERALQRHPRPCEQQSIDAFTLSTEALIAACSDERVVVRDLDDGHVVSNFPVPFGPPHKGVMTASLDATGRQLALGGVDGTLFTIDLLTGAHLGVSVADEPLVRTSWHGTQLIIGLDRGGSLLWDPALARPVLHLPADVVRSAGPNELRGWGRARWTWQLSTLAPSRYLSAAGLSHVSVSPDGTKVAGAAGNGTVTLWARDDARVLQRLDVPGGVAKRAVFSPDGTRLAVATAGPTGTVAVFDTTTWARVAWEPGRSSRRVFFLHDGRLVALPYGDGVDLWSLDGRRSTVPLPRVIDAALGAPRDGLWLLTEDERLLTWNGEGSLVRRQTPGALMLAVSSDGDVVAVARLDQVEVFVPSEPAPRIFRAKSGEVVDVAIDTTSRWVVAGTRAGTSDVFELSTGRYVAALRGHTQRTSGAAFSKDGLLFTSSWDGSVRTWNLSVLSQPAPRLLGRADEAWALPLDDALDDDLLRPR
ncbi:MAG: WD40 repeat domain-containing protein [Archangium sp.]|nr:WD40 repeat domain-containing protein [Archangium sp.]